MLIFYPKKKFLILGLILLVFLVLPLITLALTPEEQVQNKQKQIDELENQIKNYQAEIQKRESEAQTSQQQIKILSNKIKKIQAEIKSLELTIELTGLQIDDKEQAILAKQEQINRQKNLLAFNLWLLYRSEQENNPLIILVRSNSISDYLKDLNDLTSLESSISLSLAKIKDEKNVLEGEQADLEQKQTDQENLKSLQEIAQREATVQKSQESSILSQAKKRKKELVGLLNLSRDQIDRLRNEIYYLQRNGISLNDAIKYGQIVAERAGIRPAFLLALLEVESGLGTNIGSGRYRTDMNPNQWDNFFKITATLGLDPETTPVSKKPNYGWGGAMGAAQFLPGTWLGYESAVANLTGHNPPSPWRIEDSFMAAAIKLAQDGASSKSRSGELAAAKQYLSGNPNCTRSVCNWYANLVLDKAKEIELNLTPTP